MTTISNIAQQILNENNFIVDSSSTSFTAQNILDENDYTTSDISLVLLEALIDNTINYVNLQANTSIATMTGSAGSKTATATRTQVTILKALSSLMIRAYLEGGPQVSIGGFSVSAVITDPQYSLYSDNIKLGIARLHALSATNTEYLIDNAILYINSHAGTSIAALSGAAGTKSLTATDDEIIAVKLLASMMLRDSVGQETSVLQKELSDRAILALRELPIVIANEPLPNE